MKKANFTHFFKFLQNTVAVFLLFGATTHSFAQNFNLPQPGVCMTFRQQFTGGGNPPANAILNSGVPFSPSGQAPFVIEIAGQNADGQRLIPPGHVIYKVEVSVGIGHPRPSELDIQVGYNAPTFNPATNTWTAASLAAGPNTRWVTLSSDNGGNVFSSFPTFDDDADQGSNIDFPTPQVNNNFVTQRDYGNAPFTARILPEEPLGQFVGLPATTTSIAPQGRFFPNPQFYSGGVFLIQVKDDTPAPPGSANATFDATLGSFSVRITTIPGPEYGGNKYQTMATQFNPNTPAYNDPTGIRTVTRIGTTTPPDSILNNSTITKSLVFSGGTGRTITDVDVRVAFRHTFLGDLAMSLTSPGGTTVTLINRKGGNIDFNPSPAYLASAPPSQAAFAFRIPADQLLSTGHVAYPSLIFSDESDSTTVNTTSMFGNTIASQNALNAFGALALGIEVNDNVVTDHDYVYAPNYPYASPSTTAVNPRGFFPMTPEEGLSAFVGEDPRGIWTLKITDNNGRDVGVFDRFELAVTTIPKPCILDLSASGSGNIAFADSLGSVQVENFCSNQYPLLGEFIRVDTFYRHNSGTGIGNLVGQTVQQPLGTTVFQAASTNTALATNPRVKYSDPELFTVNAGTPTPTPDPAVGAQRVSFNNVKKLLPFFTPNGPNFPNTLPRHGLRIYPSVAPSQSYCRYPFQRPPVTVGAPNQLDQNPTDSIGLSVSDREPVAACITDTLRVALDTAANPGVAIINPYSIDAGSIDDLNQRGGLQFLTLSRNIGANTALAQDCSTTGTYQINYDNLHSTPAYNGASPACPQLSPALNNVKILEPLTSIIGQGVGPSYLLRVRRPRTAGAAVLGNILANDMRIILTYKLPNGDSVTRLYANTANITPPAVGDFNIPVGLAAVPSNNTVISQFATVSNVRVETRFNLTAGRVSNLSFDLGQVFRDSLRFTVFPRTVTCAEIGKPRQVMLVVKDRGNKVDSCYATVVATDGIKPTITCGTNITQTLATVNDCSFYLTQPQVVQLAPTANDNCLGQTSITVPLQRNNSIAPGLAFVLENTTDRPIVIESLKFPVLAPEPLFIRAFFAPNLTAGNGLLANPINTYPSTANVNAQYPIISESIFATGVPVPPVGVQLWRFWGQNTIPAQAPGSVTDVDFIPRNWSNLAFALTNPTTGSNTGTPYTVAGDNNMGASLVIPAGRSYGVYLAAFRLSADGTPGAAANTTTIGIVHSNVSTGGVILSHPYPLPATGAPANTRPPLIVRAGWSTKGAAISQNEFEIQPPFPTIARPAGNAFPPFSPIFEEVVNFPLSHALGGAPIPLATEGGSVRLFAGNINYVFGETKTYTPPLGAPQPVLGNTDPRNFILPAAGPRTSVNYFQKTPVFTPGVFQTNSPRTLFTYDAIKQISGLDYQQPYPIGKTINVFQVTDKAGNTATCSQTVEVLPAAGAIPQTLVCNDKVNISLDASCYDTLKASRFLANTVSARCLGAFKIEILNGTNVLGTQTGNYTGVPLSSLVGGTYTYKVTDVANSNNFCWGEVTFEDKFPPRVSCPENITVDDCSAVLDANTQSLVYTQTYSNTSTYLSAFPAGVDNSFAVIPVSAPAGARVISATLQTRLTYANVATAIPLSNIDYYVVTPSGGQLQLASRVGLTTTVDANGNVVEIPCNPTRPQVLSYNFSDNATQAPIFVTSGYPCRPADGTYLPFDDLNNNLTGILAEGDWYFMLQRNGTPTVPSDGLFRAGVGDLRLTLTMSVPIEKAVVQELCTTNLQAQLAEALRTNTCADTSIVKVIRRTYTAKDTYGNVGSCSHTISFKRPKFRTQVYPSDVIFACSYNNLRTNPSDSTAIAQIANVANVTLPANYKGPWFDSNGNPHPNVSGRPRPQSCTSYSVNYTDMRIDDICGSGNGAFAVRRTWKVYDACVNRAEEYQQYIAVQDLTAPTIVAPNDLTISMPANTCTSSITLPRPVVSDDCTSSNDINIVYDLFANSTLSIPAGNPSATAPNVFDNVEPSAVVTTGGVLTEQWYYVRYTATDKCGNTTTAVGRLKVTDLVPPTAVCAPLVKVSLGSDGTAIIDAQEFDRGSKDNCFGISRMQVWRLDDSDCVVEDFNNNGKLTDDVDKDGDGSADYPEFEYYNHPQDKVKFCCSDIGDTIMVMFRVWDYSPVRGTNSFRRNATNYDYGVGSRGNVNVCMSRVVVEDKLPPVVWTEDTTAICADVAKATDWLDLHKPQQQIPTTGFEEYQRTLFASVDKSTTIGDGVTEIQVPVAGTNALRNLDVNVKLVFDHTNIGNLSAELVSPSGVSVRLFNQPVFGTASIPFTSTGSTSDNPFTVTFDDEPSINPAEIFSFTRFDLKGVPSSNISDQEVGNVTGRYLALEQLKKIEAEGATDGTWKLRIREISPSLPGAGSIAPLGVELEICGYPKTNNLYSSVKEGVLYSSPDSLVTVIDIPVSGIDTVQDLNVTLKFHHTNIGNLSAALTSPTGTTVELFIQPTSTSGGPYTSPLINGKPSLFNLTFNDEPSVNPSLIPQFSAIAGVGDEITPATIGLVNGKYLALGQFVAFDGENAEGVWKLTITRLDPTIPDSGLVVKGGVQLNIASNRKSNNKSYFFDNCQDFTICYTDTVRLDNCGNGSVKRAWLLTDAAGRTAKDDQIYTSTGRSYYTVLFPQDTLLTCTTGSTDTSYTGKPIITIGSGCPNVAVSYQDETLNGVANACYRIKRTWKVANLCQNGMMKGRTNTHTPDVALMQSTLPRRLYKNGSDSTNVAQRPDFDTDGYVEYVQIISVNDKTAPTITNAPASIPLQPLAKDCQVKISIPAVTATDACSNSFGISWSILNKATSQVITSGTTFPAEYTFGSADFGKTFTVRYTVTDLCGNVALANIDVTPNDIIKPTPVCYQGLSVDLMPTTSNVMVMAAQFNAGSSDNCTAAQNLQLFIEKGPNFGTTTPTTNMLTIDCKGLVPIRFWVVDAAGNADYCDTYVDVQNNMGATVSNCPDITVTGAKVIATLVTVDNKLIKNADVQVATPSANILASFIADKYEATITAGSDVTVTPEKTDNPLNGISTFDLVKMTKHILGTEPIVHPLLIKAADVNNNGFVSTSDIVELRKMILAIQIGFTKNKSWRFYNNGANEFMSYLALVKPWPVTFTGVKTGDINLSANAASPKTTGTFQFDLNEKSFVAGEEVRATFNAKAIAQMEGYQFTLGYDKDVLEVANIEGSPENFGLVENGYITSSWNGNAQSGDNLFSIVFKAKKAGTLSELLNINSTYTTAEAYTKTGEYHNVALKFNGARDRFALYQNQPNPFMGRTVIGFNLPKAEHAKMTIYDIAGRVLKVVEGDFNKGYNEVIVDEILGSGVLNYKLETATETATKSMIILE
jgi:subtilisin-like proprotein convertase family protein